MFEQYGGFFALADDPTTAFVPLSAASLLEAFPARVQAVSDALPEAPHLQLAERDRVIVSVAHQGWMARLLSPMLAARLAHKSGGFLWLPDTTSFFKLALNPEAVTTAVVLRDFTRLVHQHYGVSMRVLEGNTAAALNSAARLMNNARPHPEIGPTASAIRRELQLREPGIGPDFHRHSCCLIYKLSPHSQISGSLCGDCVLRLRE